MAATIIEASFRGNAESVIHMVFGAIASFARVPADRPVVPRCAETASAARNAGDFTCCSFSQVPRSTDCVVSAHQAVRPLAFLAAGVLRRNV